MLDVGAPFPCDDGVADSPEIRSSRTRGTFPNVVVLVQTCERNGYRHQPEK